MFSLVRNERLILQKSEELRQSVFARNQKRPKMVCPLIHSRKPSEGQLVGIHSLQIVLGEKVFEFLLDVPGAKKACQS